MYGLIIMERHHSTSDDFSSDTLEAAVPVMWFSDNLDKLADAWINHIGRLSFTTSLREKINDRSFWYTNYYHGKVHYEVRIFEVEPKESQEEALEVNL